MNDRKEPPVEPGEPGPHGKPEHADRELTPRKFYRAGRGQHQRSLAQ